uniref:Uncharacterized protein n=1 Tax=Rhizophora mucronata TaxID=61149 RepID=A0A2P2NTA0_RHIMU
MKSSHSITTAIKQIGYNNFLIMIR